MRVIDTYACDAGCTTGLFDEYDLEVKFEHGLTSCPTGRAAARTVPPQILLTEGWLPLCCDGRGGLVVATVVPCDEPAAELRLRELVEPRLPDRLLTFHQVERPALREVLLAERTAELADQMANGFTREHPGQAAKPGPRRWQHIAIVAALVGFAALLVAAPMVLLAVLVLAVLVPTGINVAVSLISLLPDRPGSGAVGGDGGDDRVGGVGGERPLRDDELPFYTVIVPAYREEAVIGNLVRHLAQIDYPHDRLEVLILVERHDPATRLAVLAADPPAFVQILALPPGAPQTKPRSCNLGLMAAAGELVVIFDAEDRPEPDQLRRVAARFAAADERLACVQAKLLFQNAKHNLLTRLFALEYSQRFGMTIKGMARLGLPISLGGTSNHFPTRVLRAAGGWDAWNVTEDADLGMRCAALGYRVEVIDSTTWEEAVDKAWPYIRQRTRWLKGFMVTTLVHTRRPTATVRSFGLSGMVTLLGVVAGTALASFALPAALLLAVLAGCGVRWSTIGAGLYVPSTVVLGAVAVMLIGTAGYAGLRQRDWHCGYALLLPYVWALGWVASWRSLIQLFSAPSAWDKTDHAPCATPEGGSVV